MKAILFGKVEVGWEFRQTAIATAKDVKILPKANSRIKPYPCGCHNALFNNCIGDDGILAHICDNTTVFIRDDE